MRMTNEQRKLAEDNHNLIYSFLNKKELVQSEHYDMAAIGLCNAAMTYDSTKGKFSTYAFGCMNRELNIYIAYLNRKKHVPENIISSYDASAIDDVDGSMIDTLLKDEDNNIEYSIENMNFDYFFNKLKDREKTIVKYLKDGLTQQEIAEKLNRSQQAVSLSIKKIRNKWESYSNR